MSDKVLKILRTSFNDKRGGANETSGSKGVSPRTAKGLPVQDGQGYPTFGIKGREPLTQDMFVYKGQKLTKSQAQQKSYADVYRHEAAHLSKAGKYATSGINIDFDGNGMATSGHVNIAMPTLNPKNLKETIEQAETVEAAALAPQGFDDLSDADKSVAAQARGIRSKAIAMKNKQDKQGLGEKLNYIV